MGVTFPHREHNFFNFFAQRCATPDHLHVYPRKMSARVTARTGLLDVLDRPLALTVEILWRWLFGFLAILFGALAAVQAFAAVNLTDADQTDLLLSGDPQKAVDVLLRLSAQAGPSILHQLLWLAPVLLLFWLGFSTLGRAASCSALTLRPRADWGELNLRPYLKPVSLLQAMRAVSLCGAIALAWAAKIVSIKLAVADPRADARIVFYVVGLAVIWGMIAGAWLAFNFLLAIAPTTLLRTSPPPPAGPFFELLRRWKHSGNTWFALTARFVALKALAFVTAFTASIAAFGFAAFFPFAIPAALIAFISLAYFAVADTLFLARLSAYARLSTSSLGDEIFFRDR